MKKFLSLLINQFKSSSKIVNPEVIQALKNTHLLDKLSQKQITAIAKSAQEVTYKAGELIIKEGEIGDSFFVIKQGAVRVFTFAANGEEIVLARLEESAYFGEQALLEMQPGRRNASVKAITDVVLLKISHQTIIQILKLDKKLKTVLVSIGRKQLIEKLSRQFDIFRSLDANTLQSLSGEIIELDDGQIIFSKGDKADSVYFIIYGNIYITIDPAKPNSVVKLTAGQFFGELGVLEKTPRRGTAKSAGPSKLLVINAEIFSKLYESTPELRNFLGAFQRAYEIPSRGIVTLYKGSFLGMDTVSSAFKLEDGRTAVASQVIGQEIFTLTVVNVTETNTIRYEKNNIIREIIIKDKKIVGITNYGYWDQLGYVCGLILDNISIEPEQLISFPQTGTLTASIPIPLQQTVCYCMRISRNEINAAIRAGLNNLELISKETGAGKVCGSCRPNILTMLGKEAWTTAFIDHSDSLHTNIRTYQFKSYKAPLQKYQPGQYIIIQAYIEQNWIERAYTLISVSDKDDYYEVAVKCEKLGYFSRWLFDNDNRNPLIKISAPQGNFIFDLNKEEPAIFFAGGIGVAPAVAFVRALAALKSRRSLYLDYSAYTDEELVFLDEFLKISKELPNFTIKTRATNKVGIINLEEIKQIVKNFPQAEYFICGKSEFEKSLTKILKSLHIPDEKIKVEEFTPAGGPV